MKIKRLFLGTLCLLGLALRAAGTVYYVNANNPAPLPPFTSWDTAATNIQDAINLTVTSDTVLVTNGVYAYGGLVMAGDLVNRVALTNAITVQSVNGPWATAILGAGATNGAAAVRCAWLTNGAALVGFTLQGGATRNSGDQTSLESGGGAWCASSNALVANCVIVSNTAYEYGGGVYQGSINNSLVSSNGAWNLSGGAAYKAILNNCTVVSNSTYGVVSPLAMTNCIIYYNLYGNVTGGGSAFVNCCTTPALAGTGNLTNAPQFLADGVHLAANSPCIGAGVGIPAGTDIFGNVWSNPPSIGCAEWSPMPLVVWGPATQFPVTGGIAIGVSVAGQPPFACWWTRAGLAVQNDENHSGAGTPSLLINNFALSDAGAYQVIVSNSFGMATSVVSQVSAHCVAASGAAQPPYSDWTTAATNIQDAIDAAGAGEVVLVTNGLYAGGGLVMEGGMTNRVALNQAIMVQSVNGPWVTTIQGGNRTNGAPATRCAWLTNGAALVGFTLEGGATLNSMENGGGVWCASSNAFVANCVICSNIAYGYGGGVYSGTLRNCAIHGNNCLSSGSGGSYQSYLNNCTVAANSGGGTYFGAFTNCIIYFNLPANMYAPGPVSYCCTYPLPSSGVGNFTNAPQLFADNVHLLTNSPCIGAGTNLGSSADIDGRPWGSSPSIGCSGAPTAPLAGQPVIQLTNSPVGFVISAVIDGAGPLSFWWLENGIPLQNGGQFSSTQTPNLVATAVTFADAGGYQLVVSNSFGVVTSAVAQVVAHCVDAAGINPVAPYSTWATAATNIQDAITSSSAGDIVLVTNGLYASGGISMDGIITNRVSVNKAIIVQSVNGPNATLIQGARDPVSTNGLAAIRCVWLTNNAIISGFALENGATRNATTSTNPSMDGGGVCGSTTNAMVYNCIIATNYASNLGGGAYRVTLNNCVLTGNTAVGVPASINASAGSGGGAESCSLVNCLIKQNSAFQNNGGGVDNCNLKNCALVGNSGGMNGDGAAANGGTLINCTVSGNIAWSLQSVYGGAVYGATLTNCVIFGNFAYGDNLNPNYISCKLAYCCTDPLAAGIGNIDIDPQLLADGFHLASTSPCIGGGNAAAVYGTDIDGQPWNNPPSIGCDEWQPVPLVVVQPAFQVGMPPHALTCIAAVAGLPPFSCFWSHNSSAIQDDGHHSNSGTPALTINNFGPDDAGSYQVIVTNTSGAVTSAVVQLTIHAVSAAGSNPVPPFATWATAATNIQDAVNIAGAGDIVLVTNGIYAYGGLAVTGGLTNRVAITNAITVVSVSGYNGTAIQGAWDPATTEGPGAVRCAYIGDGAVLNGFTLRNGATLGTGDSLTGGPLESGGAVYCSSVNGQAINCVLSNNAAVFGGGMANGTLNNSLVVLNQAAQFGGGAYSGILNNCTMVDNTAIEFGGGTYSSAARNCIVVGNYDGPFGINVNNYYAGGTLQFSYTCTSPLPSGTGNTNVSPQILDDFHIASTSPCRGAGSSVYASGYDLDGEPWNNPPSMGCDEVVSSNLVGALTVSLVALQTNLVVKHFGDFWGYYTGCASTIGWSFGDGATATNSGASTHLWAAAGTYTVTFTVYNNDNPAGVSTNLVVHVQPLAVPQMLSPVLTTNGFQFQFAGQTNAIYYIQYATNLVPPVSWQNLQIIPYNTQSVVQVLDAAVTNTTRFYRVSAQ
jgi:hypothetical protein